MATSLSPAHFFYTDLQCVDDESYISENKIKFGHSIDFLEIFEKFKFLLPWQPRRIAPPT